jgi:hypothetical protein
MEEIVKAFTSPAWWVLAVLVSLIVNVASAYCKTPLDQLIAKVSATWKARFEKENNAFLTRALELAKSPEDANELFQEELRTRINYVTLYLYALVLFGMAMYLRQFAPTWDSLIGLVGIALLIGSLAFLSLGFSCIRGFRRAADLLRQAKQFQRDGIHELV